MTKPLINLLICVLIKQSFGDNLDSNTIENNCVTNDGNKGLCLSKELCHYLDTNDTGNCGHYNVICCPLISIQKANPFWASINNFWNNLANLSNNTLITIPLPVSTTPANYIPESDAPGHGPDHASSQTQLITKSVCGRRNLKKDYGFIVGGSVAPPHSWPWAVAVYTGLGSSFHNYKFICGASVISERWVLGAAHCASHNNRQTKPDNIRLLIGAHDRRYEGMYYKVDKVLVHNKYDERLMQNDIALYRLADPINFNKTSNISPVCLPHSSMQWRDLNNQTVQLVGWGTTSAGGQTSDLLRQVQVPIINNKDCARSYNSLMITSKQMCAGFATGKRDSCQGDSGGPMTMQLDDIHGAYIQVGIVSWGKGCAEAKYPGVYTKVSHYIDWIQTNILEN